MNIFTFDVDWAPESVIEDTLNILDSYGISGTFFATHYSNVLKQIEKEGKHEIGIHPNFNPLLNGQPGTGNYQRTIDDLLEMYPSAVGLRSHSLAHSCPMLIYSLEKNIKYDSNIYIPFGKDIKPFDYFGLTRIPYNWEDDGQWVSGKTFDDCELDLNSNLNIFSFHPIHIYLNTHSQQMYDSLKHFYQVPEELLKNRNNEVKGTRDLLLNLLNACKTGQLRTMTLKEYYLYTRENPTSLV
jgi:hypothetical protein